MTDQQLPTLAILVPVFNEAQILSEFHKELSDTLASIPNPYWIYFIDDGSTDRTPEILQTLAQKDDTIRVITLSRNFGHQAALSCGIDHAEGDILITMDGDGQNPPELIPEMLALYQSGYDIVIGQRQPESSESGFKRLSSQFFYKLINRIGNQRITPNAADFRLLSRRAAEALKSMPEYHRFLRGMVSWVGFNSTVLPFEAKPRIGGNSKYTLKKMIKLAWDAIFSFSLFPLNIGLAVGAGFYILAFLEAIYVLSLWLAGNSSQLEPGWSSLMFMILIVGGTLTTVVSFIGIYIGYIFQEVKNRPAYIIKDTNIKRK
ncbi:glycosyltransferase family 2 protein [bacterium]|nr:glycosyltransferase family 2 protein [bacterium]